MAIHYVNANLGTITIPLTLGQCAIIDLIDYGLVSPYTWRATKRKYTHYADATLSRRLGKRASIRMHRLIMGAPSGVEVDHIDLNGLNNCRKNLRLATSQQNRFNQRHLFDTTSRYKGVYWYKRDGVWVAQITHGGVNFYLGRYRDETEAAREHFGDFARCNFEVQK